MKTRPLTEAELAQITGGATNVNVPRLPVKPM